VLIYQKEELDLRFYFNGNDDGNPLWAEHFLAGDRVLYFMQ